MEVTIFSDPLCAEGSDITTFATDGCKVIGQEASTSPILLMDTGLTEGFQQVIAAARILPKN